VPRKITKFVAYLPYECTVNNTVFRLHATKPTVGGYKCKTCLSRRNSVLLNRLRIGHTYLMQSYLLSGDDISECSTWWTGPPGNREISQWAPAVLCTSGPHDRQAIPLHYTKLDLFGLLICSQKTITTLQQSSLHLHICES